MIDTEKRTAFLKKVHLFRGMTDAQLTALAENMGEISYSEASEIYHVSDKAESFYFVYSGKVSLILKPGKLNQYTSELVSGDYFGLEIAFNRSQRIAAANAQTDTILLTLTPQQVLDLANQSTHFKSSLKLMDTTRKLIVSLKFNWVEAGETIYLLSRKHPIVLYRMLLGPVFGALIPLALFALWLVTTSLFLVTFAGLLLIAELLWVIWIVIDYGNDYYVITNRRIMWLEKVIGLYDSRQESPLRMVLPVSVDTGVLGRAMDFGEVIVRTYTSRIIFQNIFHPYQVAAMIDEYCSRTQEAIRRGEVDAMKQSIRTKLGLVKPQAPPAPPAPNPPKGSKINIPRTLVTDLFRLRTEEAGKIVYRKHWFILIQQDWLASLLILVDLILFFVYPFASSSGNRLTVIVLLLTALFILLLWWVYEFVDWRNDRFEITPEQIVDLDKKPLGREERKSANLEDILSIEYERIGLTGILLNFGTVYIKVGTTEFTFDDVADPASVQSEVEQWRNQRVIRKRDIENASERERMADWIAAYHQNAEEFSREQELKNARSKTE